MTMNKLLLLTVKIFTFQFENIQVPSEGESDPIDKVLFYKKPKGMTHASTVTLLTCDEVKEMVRKEGSDNNTVIVTT